MKSASGAKMTKVSQNEITEIPVTFERQIAPLGLNARKVVAKRYSLKDAKANPLEEWSDIVARVVAHVSVAETDPAERDQFWSWIQEHDWITGLPMTYAGNLSVEASLTAGPEAAARIPLDVVDYIRSRHALAYEMENKVHISIPDRMLAAPVDVQGDIDDRVREFILLLEMSSNEGLAHYFGEGVYQFWIRPDDLAARRFDRVELSTTAY